jgi:hypothetical protein
VTSATPESEAVVAVKIVDMLGEEVLVKKRVKRMMADYTRLLRMSPARSAVACENGLRMACVRLAR